MYYTLIIFLIVIPILTVAQPVNEDNGFKTYWSKGLNIDSDDGNFKINFGGRIQYDEAFIFQDSKNETAFSKNENSSEIRRVRFSNTGTLYKYIIYKAEFDFASGNAVVTDAFITLTSIPIIGNIRVGHQKEPFSLDMMYSSNEMTFMERAGVTNFKKQRNSGILLFNTAFNQRATWAMGAYHNSDAKGKSLPDNRYNITGRITGLPYYKKEKNKLLHLGLAFSNRNPSKKFTV